MKTITDKASSRGYFNYGWLKTYHTFSFANYFNPSRIHFGMLRVLNDDCIAPLTGFDTHPHQNMEIVSIPLQGMLKHGDSIRNEQILTKGDIQVMSAGSGIFHSEFNASNTETLQLLQLWIFPKAKDTVPEYSNHDIRPLLKKNQLTEFITPDGTAPISIKQDAWLAMGSFDTPQKFDYQIHKPGNGVYLFIIEGKIDIDGNILGRRDGIGVWETETVHINLLQPSSLLCIEVPMR